MCDESQSSHHESQHDSQSYVDESQSDLSTNDPAHLEATLIIDRTWTVCGNAFKVETISDIQFLPLTPKDVLAVLPSRVRKQIGDRVLKDRFWNIVQSVKTAVSALRGRRARSCINVGKNGEVLSDVVTINLHGREVKTTPRIKVPMLEMTFDNVKWLMHMLVNPDDGDVITETPTKTKKQDLSIELGEHISYWPSRNESASKVFCWLVAKLTTPKYLVGLLQS